MVTPTYPRAVVALTYLEEDWGAGTATPKTFTVIPQQVEWERNDARTADTARITLAYRDFPMDPRTVASCQVRILVGNVAASNDLPTAADAVFFGFLDAPENSRDEGGAVVVLECRDNTSIFLDHVWAGGMIDVSKPLQDIVNEIADAVSPGASFPTVYSTGLDAAMLSDRIGRAKFAPQKGDNAWMILSHLCDYVGAIPVFILDVLAIVTPDDFGWDRAAAIGGTRAPTTASFVYGETLTRLVYRRSFRQAKRRQIEVVCWDPAKHAATSALYPAEALTIRKVSATGKITETAGEILRYPVTGSYTQPALAALAENIYKKAAREEIEVAAITREMSPQLGNGARVTVTIAPTLTTDVTGMSQGEALTALTSGPRALAPDVAQAFVGGATRAGNLAVEFYARSVRHRWTADDGYTCDMTLINQLGGSW